MSCGRLSFRVIWSRPGIWWFPGSQRATKQQLFLPNWKMPSPPPHTPISRVPNDWILRIQRDWRQFTSFAPARAWIQKPIQISSEWLNSGEARDHDRCRSTESWGILSLVIQNEWMWKESFSVPSFHLGFVESLQYSANVIRLCWVQIFGWTSKWWLATYLVMERTLQLCKWWLMMCKMPRNANHIHPRERCLIPGRTIGVKEIASPISFQEQ